MLTVIFLSLLGAIHKVRTPKNRHFWPLPPSSTHYDVTVTIDQPLLRTLWANPPSPLGAYVLYGWPLSWMKTKKLSNNKTPRIFLIRGLVISISLWSTKSLFLFLFFNLHLKKIKLDSTELSFVVMLYFILLIYQKLGDFKIHPTQSNKRFSGSGDYPGHGEVHG